MTPEEKHSIAARAHQRKGAPPAAAPVVVTPAPRSVGPSSFNWKVIGPAVATILTALAGLITALVK